MEHHSIPYTVVRTASPTGWKWTVFVPGKRPKSGTAANRLVAIRLAQMAIDKAIKVPRPPPPSNRNVPRHFPLGA